MADQWVRLANRNQIFGGKPPLDLMIGGLYRVRHLLDARRGAWYAAFTLKTAHAEAIHARTRELEEIDPWFDTARQMVSYPADLSGRFDEIRGRKFAAFLDPDDYTKSQVLARELLDSAANGIVYPSVREHGGTCLACFRPRLVRNVKQGAFFEYRWTGSREPAIRKL